ncbi:hypothetical protein V5O48_009603 [Marasmius crinis-equi]|uniref:Ubiquitin-like protease family profile domain-containing protein n=1 Tax=Marasmius crinis-equi TaxID=585013 RepID=A0ABR3FAM3_9AGAR
MRLSLGSGIPNPKKRDRKRNNVSVSSTGNSSKNSAVPATPTSSSSSSAFSLFSLGRCTTSPKKPRAKRSKDVLPLPLPALRAKIAKRKFENLRATLDTPKDPVDDLMASLDSVDDSNGEEGLDDVKGSGGVGDCGETSEDNGDGGDYSNNDNKTSPPGMVPSSQPRRDSYLEDLPGFCDAAAESPNPLNPPSSCKTAAQQAADLVENWKELLPTLLDSLLLYNNSTITKVGSTDLDPLQCRCTNSNCMLHDAQVHLYHFEYHGLRIVQYCTCRTLAQVLVTQGFFPTSPSQHRQAIAIPVLEFHRALSEQSSDAVTALAGAMETMYRRRGFRLVDSDGKAIRDPLRRALGHSLEWYDTLQVHVRRFLDSTLDHLKRSLPPLPETLSCQTTSPLTKSTAFSKIPSQSRPAIVVPSSSTSPPLGQPPPTSAQSARPPLIINFPATPDNDNDKDDRNETEENLKPGECDPYLQRLCPACFSGSRFGWSFKVGGDIHVACDGSFQHRHMKSGGDGIPFHLSERYLSTEYVDAVGQRLDAARSKPPKARDLPVPNEVVDADQHAHKAAKGDTEQSPNGRFDHNGLMALVCRHDIPLFIASIDTPGEQQKYAVALVEKLYSMLPEDAAVLVLYDIACVLDRSIQLYDFLPDSIVSRLQFATAAMHAYAHQWSCQLHYNPRLRWGLGLTDGEGTERLWSRLRKLIGIERRSSLARRAWLLDRQCDAIAQDNREDLGSWITRRLIKNVQKKEAEAVNTLRKNALLEGDLRQQWVEQRAAQTSLRSSNAPTRLKKELAKVIQLQGQILDLEKSITQTKAAIQNMPFPPADSTFALGQLTKAHQTLKAKADVLYTSLDLPQDYPELQDIPLEYLHTLILARDIKFTIRSKAIHSFFEYDRIDGAIGGAHGSIGTKQHQLTRKSIAARTPALQNLIRKYNQYCAYLASNYKPEFKIPVPKELPVNVAALRDLETSHLYEDVWITASQTPPRWLTDEKVREGIRAIASLDRAAEERVRLAAEADNLVAWYRYELYALKVMESLPQFVKYQCLVKLRIDDHLHLGNHWANPFIPKVWFQQEVTTVESRIHGYVHPPLSNTNCQSTAASRSVSRPSISASTPSTPHLVSVSIPVVATNDAPDGGEEEETPEALYLADILAGPNHYDSDDDNDDNEDDEASLVWEPLPSLRIGSMLYAGLHAQGQIPIKGAWNARRVLYTSTSRYIFGREEFHRLDDAKARLDDDCVNYCAALLQHQFHGQDYSMLSTYTVPELLKPGQQTDTAWRTIRISEYWMKDTWLVPIHSRAMEHWAIAVVKGKTREIYMFDSLSSREFLNSWYQQIRLVISRLVQMAQSNGKVISNPAFLDLSDWVARPLQMQATQSNGYDCGIWILWVCAIVLRGFDWAPLEEKFVPRFRKYLSQLARTLPLCQLVE